MRSAWRPVGWRGESYRHYLAAKGIKSKHDPQRYFSPLKIDVSAKYDGVVPEKDMMGGNIRDVVFVVEKRDGDYFITPERFNALSGNVQDAIGGEKNFRKYVKNEVGEWVLSEPYTVRKGFRPNSLVVKQPHQSGVRL